MVNLSIDSYPNIACDPPLPTATAPRKPTLPTIRPTSPRKSNGVTLRASCSGNGRCHPSHVGAFSAARELEDSIQCRSAEITRTFGNRPKLTSGQRRKLPENWNSDHTPHERMTIRATAVSTATHENYP